MASTSTPCSKALQSRTVAAATPSAVTLASSLTASRTRRSSSKPNTLFNFPFCLQVASPANLKSSTSPKTNSSFLRATPVPAMARTNLIYRNADVIDISKATNVLGKYDGFNESIASRDGVLKSEITPAEYCPWLSYNVNPQLNRFGVRNGGAQDQNLLNEKWESFALLEVDDDEDKGKDKKDKKDDGKDYYLISFSDNDFITQDGKLSSPSACFRAVTDYM
jgi:hypothetical protein